jgi:predicted permease
MIPSLVDDFRQAWRILRRAPGFTLTVVLTLGLGIGATTTLVSALDALLLRPPAGVTIPDRVARVYFRFSNPQFGEWRNPVASYPDFVALGTARSFAGLAARYSGSASLGRGADAAEVSLAAVTGSYFQVLGTRALIGRTLLPDDDRPETGVQVAVLSERLWRTRFGGDAGVLGRQMTLDNGSFTIVGVAPAGFDGGESEAPDMWVPLTPIAGRLGPDWRNDRNWFFIGMVGRLTAGVAPQQAAAEASTVIRAFRGDSSEDQQFRGIQLGPVLESAGPDFTDQAKLAGWLAAMAVVVLLIASTNVANLLLARGLTRARELAVRRALGAGRGRLVRQLVAEGVLTSALAGVAGILLAVWGGGAVRGYVLPSGMAERFTLDGRIYAIAIGATLLAALVASVAPAVSVTRSDLTPLLKDGSRGAGFRRSPLRGGLVVAQVALSVLLVIGAGLFLVSLRKVLAIDIGYDRSRVIMVSANLGAAGYNGVATGEAFEAMAEAVRRHSGVASAALTSWEPFGWTRAERLRIPGRDSLPRLSSGGPYIERVTADFFPTMGLRVVRGRAFTDADRRKVPTVAMLGATMARRFFGEQDPVGQCLILGDGKGGCTTVVGVVEDGIRYSPQEEPQALYYIPLPPPDSTTGHMTLFVRSKAKSGAMLHQLRPLLQAAVADLPYIEVRSLDEVLEPGYRSYRLGAALFGIFAGAAVLLAGLGVYSVLAYAVRGRNRELGVRLALGASPPELIRLVVGDGLRLVAIGLVLGWVVALAGGRALGSLLYGVAPTDPLVLGLSLLVLLGVALVASMVPARRAARVDPMAALRAE